MIKYSCNDEQKDNCKVNVNLGDKFIIDSKFCEMYVCTYRIWEKGIQSVFRGKKLNYKEIIGLMYKITRQNFPAQV